MFFVLSIYFSFTTRFCFVLLRFSHFVTTRIVIPFGPRKFLLLHLCPHTCSLWNLFQTRLTFHSNRYIRPIRMDEYTVQLFGPGAAARREEDGRGSEEESDSKRHHDPCRGGYQANELEGAYLVCYLVLMFQFLIQVSLCYLPLYLQSSFVFFSVCTAFLILFLAPHREFEFMILWLILQRVSSLITHCLVLPPKFHPLTIISFRVFF